MDAELLRAAQQGDREAFGQLASALARPFLAVARRILHDADLAEDATQDALVGIWHGLPSLRDPTKFEAWAYRILVRACRAEAGRVRSWTPNLGAPPVDVPDPVDAVSAVIDREQLERAFRRLSIDHRVVIVLRYFLDLPLDQVADVLRIPEGTAASRLHYAIASMRTAVEADARPAMREAIR
jgi:RNA polymerase sigma-70 factor (ECF subfamily)